MQPKGFFEDGQSAREESLRKVFTAVCVSVEVRTYAGLCAVASRRTDGARVTERERVRKREADL